MPVAWVGTFLSNAPRCLSASRKLFCKLRTVVFVKFPVALDTKYVQVRTEQAGVTQYMRGSWSESEHVPFLAQPWPPPG